MKTDKKMKIRSEIIYESKDGVLTIGHKYNYFWINVNDFGKSGNIQLSEKHFKLLKKWFKKRKRVKK